MESATSPFTSPSFSLRNRLARLLWNIVYVCLFRPSPRPFHGWREFLLRLFGAQLGKECHIYPGAVIWAPWNLICGNRVAVADGGEIYNPDIIKLDDCVTISQLAFLCGASHDYSTWAFPLISKQIHIKEHAWIASRAIIGMGVTIGEGCVIGAGSVVTKDMPAWSVCAGNPCRFIRKYEKKGDPGILNLPVTK